MILNDSFLLITTARRGQGEVEKTSGINDKNNKSCKREYYENNNLTS